MRSRSLKDEEKRDTPSTSSALSVARRRPGRTSTSIQIEQIEAQQYTIGNAATTALLQRQKEAEGSRQGDAQEGQVMAYKVVIDGTEQYLTPAQYQTLRKRTISKLREAIRLVRSHARIGKETHKKFLKETHNWVGVISDIIADVVPPHPAMWDIAEVWCKAAETAIENGTLEKAAENIRRAEARHNEAEKKWHEYLEATIGGAETAVTTLEVTRDVSFAVAGALGGVVLAPAGASLVVQGGVSALTAGGGKLIEETATRGSEMYHGLRQEWDLVGHLKSVGTAAVTGFAGTLVSGPLAQKFSSVVLGGLSDDVIKGLAVELSEETGEEVTAAVVREMFETKGQIWLRQFLSESAGGAGATVLNETIKAVLDGMEKGKMISPLQFAEKVAAEFAKGDGAAKFVNFAKQYAKSAR